jgi:26S proteasome regulatory subunit N10
VFVGHPIRRGTEEDFEDLGMRLKKNNVSLDVINFANPDNVGRLQALVNAANEGMEDAATSHFLDVPQGISHITDVMITSPILQPDAMGAGGDGGAGAGANSDDPLIAMGIDPNLDPELAMAIRLSMEEARAAD